MNIKAIPTVYGGVQFRSRLEARWAAFFDLLGWRWQYEPLDLDGWIPDFVLVGLGGDPVLVEVKPAVSAEDADRYRGEIDRDYPSAFAGGVDGATDPHELEEREVLLLGTSLIEGPRKVGGGWQELSIGWLRSYGGWDDAPFGLWAGDESVAKNPGNVIGFCHASQSFADRITGCYDGGCWGTGGADYVQKEVRRHWIEAGNRVQWRSPREVRP